MGGRKRGRRGRVQRRLLSGAVAGPESSQNSLLLLLVQLLQRGQTVDGRVFFPPYRRHVRHIHPQRDQINALRSLIVVTSHSAIRL